MERRQAMEEGTVQAGPVQEEGPELTSSPKRRQEIPKEKPGTPKMYFIQIQENLKLTPHEVKNLENVIKQVLQRNMSQTVQLKEVKTGHEVREADTTELITEHVIHISQDILCQTSASLEMMWRWKATAVWEICQQMCMLR